MSRRFLTPPQLPSGASLPSSGAAGDLFFKSDEAKIYVHDGADWVIAQGSGGSGSGVVVSATAPADPDEGTYWFDSTTTKSYIYYDSFWIEVGYSGGGYIISETAPSNPSEGDVWFSTSEGVIYVFYDNFWIDPSTGGAAGVPAGGLEGQILVKVDGDDYNTVWADNSAESTFFLVRNNSGATIPKGTLVAATGAEPSGRIDVAPFETTGLQDSELRVMGLATSNINNGVNGTVMSFGTLRAMDTRGNVSSAIAVGDETWAEGDILYAHPTVDGKLTNVRPQHDLAVAFITVRHQSSGQLAVRITPSNSHLEWLHDVELDNPTEGQVLQYDGTDWVNADLSALPDQTGNSGKFLTTDGTDASWGEVDALPDQTGNTGKYLTTDGSAPSWAELDIPSGTVQYNFISAGLPTGSLKGSFDGRQWESIQAPSIPGIEPKEFTALTYANNMFVLTAKDGGTSQSRIFTFFTSIDGITWETRSSFSFTNSGFDLGIKKIVYQNGVWLALSFSYNLFRSLDNGVTWSHVSPRPSGNHVNISTGNGLFHLIGYNTNYSSSDGVTWTTLTPPTANVQWSDSIFAFGQWFMFISNSSTFYTSPDLVTWTSRTIPTIYGNSRRGVFVNNLLVVIGENTRTAITTSTVGNAWASRIIENPGTNATNYQLRIGEVVFSNGTWVGGMQGAGSTQGSYLGTAVSNNAVHWSTGEISGLTRIGGIAAYNFVSPSA